MQSDLDSSAIYLYRRNQSDDIFTTAAKKPLCGFSNHGSKFPQMCFQ